MLCSQFLFISMTCLLYHVFCSCMFSLLHMFRLAILGWDWEQIHGRPQNILIHTCLSYIILIIHVCVHVCVCIISMYVCVYIIMLYCYLYIHIARTHSLKILVPRQYLPHANVRHGLHTHPTLCAEPGAWLSHGVRQRVPAVHFTI